MYKILCLVAACTLAAGCSQESGPPESDTDNPRVESDISTGGDPAPVGNSVIRENYPDDFALDQPIPAEAIAVDLRLVGPAGYRPDKDELEFDVEVINQGRAALVSKGSFPVHLGVTLVDSQGKDVAPDRTKSHRAELPLIVPGQRSVIQVSVPAEEYLGMQVTVEAVQEKAGWFGRRFGQPVLKVGTFRRCDGNPATLCDASGTPLPTR